MVKKSETNSDELSNEKFSLDRQAGDQSESVPGQPSGTISRRRFLGGMGAVAVAAAVGCGGGSPSGDDKDGSLYPDDDGGVDVDGGPDIAEDGGPDIEADGGPNGEVTPDLAPPTLPYPDWEIGDTPKTIHNGMTTAEIKNELRTGGLIHAEAGVYDFTDWDNESVQSTNTAEDGAASRAQIQLRAIKIIGLGSGAVFTGPFDIEASPSSGTASIFGDFRGRTVLENITFRNWRCVLRAGSAFNTDANQNADGAQMNTTRPPAIAVMDYGLACDDVRAENCGRFFYARSNDGAGNYITHISNVYLFNSVFTNTWQAFGAPVQRLGQYYEFYNCVFDRCVMPHDTVARWQFHNAGVWLCFNQTSLSNDDPDGGFIYFEHCSWNVIGCLNRSSGEAEMQCVRVTGAIHPVEFNYCTIKNHGVQGSPGDETYFNTMTDDGEIIYLKVKQSRLYRSVIETVAVAGESMWSNKGMLYEAGDPGHSVYLEDVIIRDVRPVPLSHIQDHGNPGETFGSSRYAIGLFGATHWRDFRAQNVHVENVATANGFFGQATSANSGGFIGATTLSDVTLDRMSVFSHGGVITPRMRAAADASLSLDNVLAVDPMRLGGTIEAVLEDDMSYGSPMPLAMTRISAAFTENGPVPPSTFSLAKINGSNLTLAVPPTGTITSAHDDPTTRRARTGPTSGDNVTLTPGGPEATGANKAWLTSGPRPGSSLATAEMLPSDLE